MNDDNDNALSEYLKKLPDFSRKDRIAIIMEIIELDVELNCEKAKSLSDGFLDVKKSLSRTGLLGLSTQKQTSGKGFELVWVHLERGYKKASGRKPDIKRCYKRKGADFYTENAIRYPGIQEWESGQFEVLEKRSIPVRKLQIERVRLF